MANTEDEFDRLADEYDRWFDTSSGGVLFQMEVEAISPLMKGLEKSFLEIGVGSGRFAQKLGIKFGIDPSPKLLEMARKRGITVRKAFGEDIPFNKDSFGAVFILFTLCFVKNPAKVISEAKRVLRPGGGLIVGIINRESTWGKFYMKKGREEHPIYKHARFYSVEEIVKMLEKARMKVEKYSSTLCQNPSEMPYKEAVRDRLEEGAGFICIRARKIDN